MVGVICKNKVERGNREVQMGREVVGNRATWEDFAEKVKLPSWQREW